jgi:hypothetical protein
MEAATVRGAPAVRTPARKAPARRKPPVRRPGGQLIPIAAGAATAVRQLPDSSLIVRMTSGRLWIGVLGVLLAGIVAVNVEQNIAALEQENPILSSRDAKRSGAARVRHDAGALGLNTASSDQIGYVQASARDVSIAAQRLAAAGTGY